MKFILLASVACISLLSGCASITGDSTQPIRVETYNQAGEEVKGASCTIANERGSFSGTSPSTITVHRSADDIHVVCTKDGQADAKATGVSRANAGMYGNILIGGGIGAIIDHNKGTAYGYPSWLKLIMGKSIDFDRSDDKDGQPSVAKNTSDLKVSTAAK